MHRHPTALLAALLVGGCGLLGPTEDAERAEVMAEMTEQLQPTVLAVAGMDAAPEVMPIREEDLSPPPTDAGDGLQVLHVAPVGVDRQALQAAVVFDRPMVALSDLDSMSQQVAITCDPTVPGKARWAGTSTAVFLPEGNRFPHATAFRCTVPAGAAANDGTTVEHEVGWTFETPRPSIARTVPYDDQEQWKPEDPIVLVFDQAVDPVAVAPFLELRATEGEGTLALEVGRPSEGEVRHLDRAVQITAPLERDTSYILVVSEGVRGVEGPLGSLDAYELEFSTYPPLRIVDAWPKDSSSPVAELAVQFSTEIELDKLAEAITIDPAPADPWSPPTGYETSRFSYYLRLAPRTDYTATLAAGVEDVHGQVLDEGHSWSFTTGDLPPRLDAPSGFQVYAANNPLQLPIRHLNLDRVQARVAPVQPERVLAVGWDDAVDQALRAARPIDLEVEDEPNRWEVDLVDLSGALDGSTGLVAVDLWSDQITTWRDEPRHYRSLLQVTDLGTSVKVSPDHADAWVTRLSDGRPVQDAQVQFYVGDDLKGSATTGKDGLARVTDVVDATWSYWSESVWAMVTVDDQVALTSHRWDSGIAPWRFGLWSDFDPDGVDVAAHGFTDRGIYRPGDVAHARVTFRLQSAKGLELPPPAEVSWTLSSPRGDELSNGEAELDERGGVALDVTIPADGDLGSYSLQVEASGETWERTKWLDLPVREYRPPAFRIDVSGPEAHSAGDPVTANVQARYLFGAPLKGARVKWSTWRASAWFRPEGWDGWSFGPEYRWWEPVEHEHDVLSDGEGETDAEGRFTLSQEVPVGELERPYDYTLEATVTDTDRQVISNRTTVRVHPGAFYVGLRAAERLPRAGIATSVEVVAVDHQGGPLGGPHVDVRVARRTWDRVREKGMDGRWQWVNTPVDEEVLAESVVVREGPQPIQFTPESPGYYVITAAATDTRGNEVSATETLYVVGPGYTPWALSDDQVVELVPDKQSYAPGEVARVLVKSPREGLRALVTAEREGVLTSEVLTLESTATAVEIPITEAYRPNVFVSVIAVEGAAPQDSPDKGRPQVYVGMVELSVDAEAEHLAVDVRPAREVYRPRDQVEVDVCVTREEQPVAGAGVTLYAVDEAVLTLTAYDTPDAHGTFYEHHALSVRTADSRIRVLDRAAYLTKGANPGGGGGMAQDSGPAIRKRFLATATWAPDLRTGEDGCARHAFELPDNLTTFRVMAVADAGALAFGSGDEEIRVTRPLIVRPALPRFMRPGDTAFAGVVVHNNADHDRRVQVDATASGVALEGSPVEVTVPGHGALEVPFRIHADEPGEATFVFQGQAGEDLDGAQVKLTVEGWTAQEVVASAGSTTDEYAEKIALPDGVRPGVGGLEVDLASTALVGAGSGVAYLLDYPHPCAEQRTSRGMAALVALRIHQAAGVDVDETTLKAAVSKGLTSLSRYRHWSGGLSYWPGGRYPSVMATAYGVEFMGRAREQGYDVDERLLSQNVSYLRDVLGGRRLPSNWERDLTLSAQAYVALALARAGEGDAGHNSNMYGTRGSLSLFSQASLLEAIARTTGSDGRTRELARSLESRMHVEQASASIRENQGGRWAALWGSDDLSTAAALEALLVAYGPHPLAPRLATHLVSSRQAGRWHNTRATAGVLAALAAYADRFETPAGDLGAQVTLQGDRLYGGRIPVPGTERLVLPLDEVRNGALSFQADGGRLYYEARLRYAPVEVVPRDEGFTLVRTYEVLEGEGETGAVTAGALLRVTLRVVTPVARQAVAVVDPLPAGLEPVDQSLATTSKAPGHEDTGWRSWDTGVEEHEFSGWWSTWVFSHTELRDDSVNLYADYMPAGVHTYQYVVRATTPGSFEQPAATVEEMYEPEHFGRTGSAKFTVGVEEIAAR